MNTKRKIERRFPAISKKLNTLFAFLQKNFKNRSVPQPGKFWGPKSTPINKLIWFSLLFILAFMAVRLTVLSGRAYVQSSEPVRNVHYVDSVGSNFLFRGGLPLINNEKTFNYRGLKQTIIEAGNAVGISVPKNFFIIDVNLLNIEIRARRPVVLSLA